MVMQVAVGVMVGLILFVLLILLLLFGGMTIYVLYHKHETLLNMKEKYDFDIKDWFKEDDEDGK